MFTKNKKTILDQIFEREINDYRSQFKVGEVTTITSSAKGSAIANGGHVIYPVDAKLQSINDLLHYNSLCNKHDKASIHNYELLFNSVTSKILTIDGTYTYNEAINKILPFINKAGANFYGAILRSGNVIINPFSVAAILSHLSSEHKGTFSIMMYFYPNRPELDRYYKTEDSDPVAVTSMIENILKPIGTSVTYSVKVTDVTALDTYGDFRITTSTKAHWSQASTNSAISSENYIIAHQAVTRGVLAPFYGASVLTKEPTQSAKGAHITPMLCANISQPSHSDLFMGTKGTPIFTSVCTGSNPNSTLKGLTSLTQCNMLSPYHRNIIVGGALAYVDASINKCLEIYKKTNIIEDYTPIVTPTPIIINPYPEVALVAYFTHTISDYIGENSLPFEYFTEIENHINQQGITYDKTTNTIHYPITTSPEPDPEPEVNF